MTSAGTPAPPETRKLRGEMPIEPNIYELHADIRNIGQTLDEMKRDAHRRGEMQTEILQKIAEQTTVSSCLTRRISELENDARQTKAFVWKCSGALAVLTPLAGYLLGKIF